MPHIYDTEELLSRLALIAEQGRRILDRSWDVDHVRRLAMAIVDEAIVCPMSELDGVNGGEG